MTALLRSWTSGSGMLLPALLGVFLGIAVVVQAKLTLVALVGLGLAALGVFRPVSLVGLMFMSMLVDRIGVTGMKLGDFPITLSKLSVLGSIGLWVLHVMTHRAPLLRWHPVISALCGVVMATAVGIAIHNCLNVGKFTLYGLGMMTVLVLTVYAVMAEARLQGLYRVLTLALCGALLLSLRGGGGERVAGEVVRASGTMGDPNEWATVVLLLSPFLLGGLVDDDSTAGRLCRNALMLLAPLGILRSESRTALVVMILLSPGLFYLLRRHRRELWVGAGVGLVAAPFFINLETAFYRFSQLVGNLRGSATVMDTSLEERSELLRQGLQLLRDNWILGSGPGTFPSATGFVSHEWTLRPAHNTYLELASEQGIPGMVAGGIFILVLLWSLYQGWRDSRDPVAANRVLGVGMGLAAFGLMAATLNLLTFAMGYLTLGCALALLHQARWGRDGERTA